VLPTVFSIAFAITLSGPSPRLTFDYPAIRQGAFVQAARG